MSLRNVVLDFYYEQKMHPKNLPYELNEIKRNLDEEIKVEYIENRKIRKMVQILISTLNSNDDKPGKIILKLEEHERNLKDSFLNLIDIGNYMNNLDHYGFKFNWELYDNIIKRTALLSSDLTDLIENYKLKGNFLKTKFNKAEDQNQNINLDSKNNHVSYIGQNSLKSNNNNHPKTQETIVDFTETEANNELNKTSLSMGNIIFYIYIFVFLVVIGIFSSSYIEKKIIKLRFFVKEFNKKN